MDLGGLFAVRHGPLFWPPDMCAPLFPHVGKTEVPGKAASGVTHWMLTEQLCPLRVFH